MNERARVRIRGEDGGLFVSPDVLDAHDERDVLEVTGAIADALEAVDNLIPDALITWLVGGVVALTRRTVLVRLHTPGASYVSVTPYVRDRVIAAVVDASRAREGGEHVRVFVERGAAVCVRHEECEADAEMGALCFRAHLGERA